MIVTCERCKTQFQLDDARVPESGSLVRCSRCKHAFVVKRPNEAPDEEIHRIAARAAAEGETPEVTQDLPIDTARPSVEEDESDWQFNDERSLERADAPASDSPSAGLVDASAGALAEDADDDPFGEIGPGESLGLASEETGSADAIGSSAWGAPAGRVAGPALEPSEELGSPGEWDIFGGDEEPTPVAVAPLAPPSASSLTVSLAGPERSAIEPEDRQVDAWLQRSAIAAGWLATAVLCAVGLVRGLAPPPVVTGVVEPAPGVVVEDVRARWVDNARLGPIYVVSGILRNTEGASRSVPALELVLRDAAGREVGLATPLGNLRSPLLLREAGASVLRASSPPHRPLRAAETRAFEAVPWPLPREAAAFEIRAAADAG